MHFFSSPSDSEEKVSLLSSTSSTKPSILFTYTDMDKFNPLYPSGSFEVTTDEYSEYENFFPDPESILANLGSNASVVPENNVIPLDIESSQQLEEARGYAAVSHSHENFEHLTAPADDKKEKKRLKNFQYKRDQKEKLENLRATHKKLQLLKIRHYAKMLIVSTYLTQCQCSSSGLKERLEKQARFYPRKVVEGYVAPDESKKKCKPRSPRSINFTPEKLKELKNARDKEYRRKIKEEKEKLEHDNQLLEDENDQLNNTNLEFLRYLDHECSCQGKGLFHVLHDDAVYQKALNLIPAEQQTRLNQYSRLVYYWSVGRN